MTDVLERVAYLKWSWARHITRKSSENESEARISRIARGRPPTRRTDDLKRIAASWIKDVQDRKRWKSMREAYDRLFDDDDVS